MRVGEMGEASRSWQLSGRCCDTRERPPFTQYCLFSPVNTAPLLTEVEERTRSGNQFPRQ